MKNKSVDAHSLALAGIVAAAFVVAGSAANAQGTERFPRWYIGFEAGGAMTHDTEASGTTTGDVSLDNGMAYGGSIGYMPAYRTGPGGFRFELEIFHRENGLDALESSGVSTPLNGDFKATSYMGNVFYDINTNTSVLPYLGAGIGWSSISLDSSSGLGNTSDSDSVFSWQVLTGISYLPVSIPYTMLNLGYRFHADEDAEFGTSTGTVSIDGVYSHSLEAGMKFRF